MLKLTKTMDITTATGIVKEIEINASELPITPGNETSLPPYNDKTFIIIYTTLRCIQGFMTIVGNVITIIAITRYKKVSICGFISI